MSHHHVRSGRPYLLVFTTSISFFKKKRLGCYFFLLSPLSAHLGVKIIKLSSPILYLEVLKNDELFANK